jgi:hypothetical protein
MTTTFAIEPNVTEAIPYFCDAPNCNEKPAYVLVFIAPVNACTLIYFCVKHAPNTASTPTGGSDTVTGLLSKPKNIPSNQIEPSPPTSG